MTNFFKYATLVVFSFLWFLGCSPNAAKWLNVNGITPDDYRYGDLYRFSNLRQFRVPVQKCGPPNLTEKMPVHLVLVGDSFTEEGRIEKDHFVAQDFTRNYVAADSYVQLSPTKKNVLVIETVERHFRERFDSTYTCVKVNKTEPDTKATLWEAMLDWQLPYNEEMHTSILFSADFFLTLKEWKAAINQRLFERVDDNVRLSADGTNIVYGLAVKPGINSSFDDLPDEEITRLVANVNATYAIYKKAGFDEVYLNIIPNKASIVATDLGKYNHLIERVQTNPDLEMPFIDSYHPLKNGGEQLFDKGDTHWNCKGKQLWINAVNELLRKQSRQP